MGKRVLTIVIVFLFTLAQTVSLAADAASVITISETASSSSNIAAGPDNPDVKVSKEEAKKIALNLLKKHFGLEVDEKKYRETAQLNPYYENKTLYSWSFSWSFSNNAMYTHFSVEIDASTGKLLSFNRSESYRNQEQVTVATITMEHARKLADEFLNNICPDEYKQVELEDDYRQSVNYSMVRPRYNFNYIRKANGLRCPGSYMTVGVNGANGSISSYHSRWDYDAVFPAVGSLIEKEKALEIYKKETDMKLYYIPVRNRLAPYTVPTAVKLAYISQMSNSSILDAQTGELLKRNDSNIGSLKTRDIAQDRKNSLLANSNEPLAESAVLDSEAAETRMKSIAKEFFGAGYKVDNLIHTENVTAGSAGNSMIWRVEVLEDKEEAFESKGSISIDGSTGELQSIGRYLNEDWYGKEYERKISWEQAYDKAVELLTKYFPHRLDEIETEQISEERLYAVNDKMLPERMVYFNFPRSVDGIQYGNDHINITVDTKTGEINDVYYRWSKGLSFPKAEGVIDREKAELVYFNAQDIVPTYYKHTEKTEDNKQTESYKVIYILEQKQDNAGRIIDAFTGKLLDSDGEEVEASQNDFNELIKGHPYEKELDILAFQGIIDRRSFDPDKEITYIELIRMLVNAKGYRPYTSRDMEELAFKNIDSKNENYSYLYEAVRYGIIENKPVELKLDAKVTREQLAELMVKLLKYDRLAKAGDIFVLDFKDSDKISSELRGHVAIIKGLGIMSGNEGIFRPNDNVKLHEAALTVYKALESMK
ncbi:MAG TPA: YcdB/YcdC domain-containing protein [Clostridia bacterium]|nr:YcdB/YcdC domain-containing protein [Clostridia bacterium]